MVVVTDHDSKVLARRTFRCKAWDLGTALDWAAERGSRAGFAGVRVACEPTGHRWRVLGRLAGERGMSFVCVQPAVSAWVRKTEDLTSDKTDDKDAVLIARLTAQLRCYLPEPVEETWGRLRHLGVRREQLIGEHVACVQQVRDLLECVWPAALAAANWPFRSATWVAALAVVVDRDGGDLARTRRLGPARFERAVRKEVTRRGGQRPCLRITRRLFAALSDTAGVITHRPAAFERIAWVIDDWDHAKTSLADIEARMVSVLDDLKLTELATSIDRLSPIGAAAILAETGDLTRFTSARAVVKHAGLAPRERKSGAFTGRARVTGAGRPLLRAALPGRTPTDRPRSGRRTSAAQAGVVRSLSSPAPDLEPPTSGRRSCRAHPRRRCRGVHRPSTSPGSARSRLPSQAFWRLQSVIGTAYRALRRDVNSGRLGCQITPIPC